ncbi:hypothetical protein D9M71_341110 [compost metagenome]
MLYGKAETDRFVFAEIGHLDVLQVALIDHVMGGNGIAEKHVGLIEGDGIEGIQIGRVGLNRCLRVVGPYLCKRQVVIDHAQAQASQTGIKRAAFVFAGHQHRLIDGVGSGKHHPRCGGFKAIGTAEHVYLPQGQGFHRFLAAGKAPDLNRQAQRVLQYSGNVSSQAFVVATAGGHVEGWIIRCRSTQQQLLFACDPASLRRTQREVHAHRLRAA